MRKQIAAGLVLLAMLVVVIASCDFPPPAPTTTTTTLFVVEETTTTLEEPPSSLTAPLPPSIVEETTTTEEVTTTTIDWSVVSGEVHDMAMDYLEVRGMVNPSVEVNYMDGYTWEVYMTFDAPADALANTDPPYTSQMIRITVNYDLETGEAEFFGGLDG